MSTLIGNSREPKSAKQRKADWLRRQHAVLFIQMIELTPEELAVLADLKDEEGRPL
jgi:hypothetical protein